MEKIKNICRDLGKAFTIGLLSGGAAAAVLLVAVSSVSLWLLQSPVGNEMRHTSVPCLLYTSPRPRDTR